MKGKKKGILVMALALALGVCYGAGNQVMKGMEAKEKVKENVNPEESRAVLQGDVSMEEPEEQREPEEKEEKGTALEESTDPQQEYEEKRIALTFDDGPHPSYTEELLDGLKERGVKATFFVLGEHAQLHPDVIKRMQEEGHLIGNHTYSHIQLKDGNWEEYRQELIKTSQVIQEIIGEEVAYVRPPYGSWDKSFEEELNMFPVLWTVDSRDWCSRDAASVVKRVVQDTEEGDIILMHDYYASTVTAALEAVDELQKKGYTFVTVEDILFD